ncbi:MAG: 1-acyl-sn-glycerol-3-phosphate acyltransferase [Clostridiales bacterium]|nr:1-acyl-sn-glycerol-3-phosphate acyltransferase [Clostridiales bacterium]
MIGNYKRFDVARKPNRQWAVLRPVVWLLSYPKVWMHRTKVDKSKLPKGMKGPYFLLCNHNSFMDFMITTAAIFPNHANYIVAIDGFIGIEGLLRAVGGIGNRKFAKSVSLVKNMLLARKNKSVIVLYPEARYSLCGTSAVLPASLGKMVQKMNIPVVSLLMHGHHVNSPFWHVGSRGVKPVEAEMQLLITQEETQSLSMDEINARIKTALTYDDFAWQLARGIRIKTKDRAEGLEKVLYQCPACKVEYKMSAKGTILRCDACGKEWEMTELGELAARSGETEFSHIPDWYEWERANVRREVQDGSYHFESEVRIESLPNAKGFITFPEPGHLTHDMTGFTLRGVCEGEPFTEQWTVPSLYSCHIEYNYKGRGDCVDLNTNDDTFYCFPLCEGFSVTKMALATEELHFAR